MTQNEQLGDVFLSNTRHQQRCKELQVQLGRAANKTVAQVCLGRPTGDGQRSQRR